MAFYACQSSMIDHLYTLRTQQPGSIALSDGIRRVSAAVQHALSLIGDFLCCSKHKRKVAMRNSTIWAAICAAPSFRPVWAL